MALSRNVMKMPGYDYNKFFHPNVCHVCKTYNNREGLKSCLDCNMIFYCSEEHRSMHEQQHSDLCAIIRIFNKTRSLWNTRNMTMNDWILHRKKNLQAIQSMLHREMKPYEKQMFLFAKSCHICHQQHGLTTICPKCNSHYMCDDHKSMYVEHDCLQLKRSLFLDINDLTRKRDVRIPQCFLAENVSDMIINYNMKLIVQRYRGKGSKVYLWKPDDYNYSDFISGPLTLCYIMQHLDFLSYLQAKLVIVIHIIAGNLTDTQSLSAWEIVLHTLLPGTKLTIVMVESELQNKSHFLWNVCEMCRALNKTLCFESHVMSYKNYVQYPTCPPDLIVGFQANLMELGSNIIKEVQRLACPLVLTTSSKWNALENSRKIKKVLGSCPFPCINGENSFRSNKPHRNLKGRVSFRNNYLTVYDNLSV